MKICAECLSHSENSRCTCQQSLFCGAVTDGLDTCPHFASKIIAAKEWRNSLPKKWHKVKTDVGDQE